MRKFNNTGDFRINSEMGGDFEELALADKHLEILKPFAENVLQACPYQDLLYARQGEIFEKIFNKFCLKLRVDIALTHSEGNELRPVLMELELFEPDVYVGSAQSVRTYVDAIELKLKDKMSTENI